jgi:hypothetical protein
MPSGESWICFPAQTLWFSSPLKTEMSSGLEPFPEKEEKNILFKTLDGLL